jgi:hypothetical protein
MSQPAAPAWGVPMISLFSVRQSARPKVCQLFRLDASMVVSGRKEGPEAKSCDVVSKMNAISNNPCFFAIDFDLLVMELAWMAKALVWG